MLMKLFKNRVLDVVRFCLRLTTRVFYLAAPLVTITFKTILRRFRSKKFSHKVIIVLRKSCSPSVMKWWQQKRRIEKTWEKKLEALLQNWAGWNLHSRTIPTQVFTGQLSIYLFLWETLRFDKTFWIKVSYLDFSDSNLALLWNIQSWNFLGFLLQHHCETWLWSW